MLVCRHCDEAEFIVDDPARYSIFCQFTIVLEIEETAKRVRSEDTVDLAGVETEGVEKCLEICNIIPTHHGNTPIEEAVTELIARIDERPPGLGADDAINWKSPLVLETGDGREGAFAEFTRHVGMKGMVQPSEPILNIAYRCAAVSLVKEPHELDRARLLSAKEV
jgi:hypothetical protein